ncbi:hypothetical protein NL108_002585 [Boleophthalmus pectinirostris]|nr:hypothetical protein NL108_002585 [Boleophthalmus pectinirostris]
MTSNYRLIPLLLAISTIYGKYIYEKKEKTWEDAQSHCRSEYTDLAPISNNYDRNLLFEQYPEARKEYAIWIGLTRKATNHEQWLWSGGDVLQENKTFWMHGEPNDSSGKEDRGSIYGSSMTWNDIPKATLYPSFCYKVHVVSERKTWEEALDYCREHHRDLASVASKTELMLMQKELGKALMTEKVWIGLRFLAGDWAWVDKQPLEYEAWDLEGEKVCPVVGNCCGLLLLLVSVTFGKYIYVEESMQWDKAQDYCRRNYTDLAPVNNEYDVQLLFEDGRISQQSSFWIGLMRNPENQEQWMWSGGSEVKADKTFWSPGEPNNYGGTEDRGHFAGDAGWNDVQLTSLMPFVCYKVHVVSERKTWEEALDYCREHHHDLASVASETELMLMQKELGKSVVADHVWIGLHFLAGDWLWLDKQPLEYEAWGLSGKPGCPALSEGCAALEIFSAEAPFGHTAAMASKCGLLLLLVSVTFGKYIYVEESMQWDKAQDYCREHYTDLAPVNNEYDVKLLFEDDRINNRRSFWIGLMLNPENQEQWMWSGGGEVKANKTFWRPGEPNNRFEAEYRGHFAGDAGWNDAQLTNLMPFVCYKVHVVSERKTWEEALDYCREHHHDLASVASETELMLMQKELSKSVIADHVWIGLQFLAGDWLWVDKQPLEYEAWGLSGKPGCPALNEGCAALEVVIQSSEETVDVKAWNTHNCDEKFYFMCY